MTRGTARAPLGPMAPTASRTTTEPDRIDVAIADKSPLILAGLDKLLSDDRRFTLVAKLTDGEEFLEAARQQKFTIAVIGWQLPTLHARDVLRALSRQVAAPKIVVYSGTNDPAAPAETLQLGGAGFVSKRAPPERLLDVLAAVAAGDMVFPFVDIRKMRSDPLENLTLRERSLLSALGSGHTNSQLAKDFGVSINTIKFHLRNLFEKLDVRNRAQAIALFSGDEARRLSRRRRRAQHGARGLVARTPASLGLSAAAGG